MKITCVWTGKQAYGTIERALVFAAKISTREGRPYRPYKCQALRLLSPELES